MPQSWQHYPVFSDSARFWFRTIKGSSLGMQAFVDAFKDQYGRVLQDQDLLVELQKRFQGDTETVVEFITCFRAIVNHFKLPPPENQLLEMAYAQLRPKYRKSMRRKRIHTFDDIIKYGKRFEQELLWDSRFTAPTPVRSL